MAARSIRNSAKVLPLLTLLLLGASATANSPERAVAAARTALDRGEVGRARQIVDDALRAFGNQDRLEVWTLRVMRGEVALTEGDMAKVTRELAFELPAKFRNSPAAVRRLIYQASALGSAKEKQEPLLNAAHAIATRHQPLLLAEVARAKARLYGSEKEAREAVRLADKHRLAVEQAKARVTLASILTRQQRFAEAIEVAEPALTLARQHGLANTVQNVEGTLGWAYFETGDYEAAAELFARAEASAGRIGNRLNQASWLIQLGNVHFQQRDFAGADRHNERAVAIGANGSDLGYALANRARAALEQGRYTDARRLNAQALEAKRAVKDEEAELSSQIVEARIVAAQERDYARAEKMLLAVLDKQTKRHELDARTQLADLYARTGRHELARSAYRRAVETARALRGNIADRELRFAFFNTVPDMLDAYVDLLLTMKRSDEALAVIEASRAEALEEGRADELRRLDPEAIAKQNGATILSYWLGRDRSYLWVITASTTTLHPLPAEALMEKEVEVYRRAVTRGDSMAATAARGERLYDMLVAPAKIAKGTRVIVIADGQLHTLPFYTLVAPAPRRYWIEDVTVVSAASLRLLTRKPRIPAAAPSVLIVGNAPSYDPAFPPLQHAPQEIAAIGRRFVKKTVLEGPKATPAAYQAASPGEFDYVHFVAHGVAMRKRPLDSAVLLAKGAKSYKLLAREVAETPLKARLVTISSCESAGTRTYAGEGVIGLAWAFLDAGADQVIASLWKVSDATTPQLMDEMYAGIRKGQDPADALRNAKLRMLHSGTRASRPYYWAPFVLYAGT